MPKVSIVIPIYRVELYIERCARSLFEQTLDSLEYIFVNDCTPDNSMTILNRVLADYPQRKEQVHVINHAHNMGSAKARETGIKAATADFIIHCDSDDWAETDAYQRMYDCALKNNYDIVIGDYCEHNGTCVLRKIHQQLGVDPIESVIERPIRCSLWNKLVKRSLFANQDIYYALCSMQEDNVLCVQMLYYAQKIGYLDDGKPTYYYFINPSSICHNNDETSHYKRWKEAYVNTQILCKFAKDKGFYAQYENAFLSLQANVRGFLMPLMKQNNRYYKEWYHCFPKLNWRYIWLAHESISLKIVFILTQLGIYPFVSKLINRK